ncbi:putative WD-repeat membrane protein [Giardia muris]|uniref:Putative WD-repeat membrane protein n=1 Tax=Giardia muris TaxID=5742 RepID=A0A4Z1SS89_GIAMU|nr:putative WD-repeat membrane protein [Giardia muris]|eukprot:TNJ28802.1 putative WD-repeat membrane protein [Giardia muris]
MFQLSQIVGIIIDDVIPSLYRDGADYYLTLSVGHEFIKYRLDTLDAFVFSSHLPHRILHLATHATLTAVAYEGSPNVEIFTQTVQTHTLKLDSQVVGLLTVGEIVFAITDRGSYLVFDMSLQHQVKPLRQLPLSSPGRSVAGLMHPDTYLNKILVWSSDGAVTDLELFNVDKNKRIARFEPPLVRGEPILLVVNTPEVDVVGIVQPSRLCVFHLRKNETLFVLKPLALDNQFSAAVFSPTYPIVICGTTNGSLIAFDLEERVLLTTLHAHDAAITHLAWLSDEYFFTSGLDNSIRICAYDTALGVLRVVKDRTGHRGPISFARFYREDGGSILQAPISSPFLLTVGVDNTLRYTQIYRRVNSGRFYPHDRTDTSPIIDFDACEIRDEQWANIITAHSGMDSIRAWAFFKRKEIVVPLEDRYLGRHLTAKNELRKARKQNGGNLPSEILREQALSARAHEYALVLPTSTRFEKHRKRPVTNTCTPNETVTSCAISLCGNYAALGGTLGSVAVYALQSGRLVAGIGHLQLLSNGLDAGHAITRVMFDIDSRYLFILKRTGELGLWNTRTGSIERSCSLSSLTHIPIVITASAVDIQHQVLAIASTNGLWVINLRDFTVGRFIPEENDIRLHCVSFSNSGQRVIYAYADEFNNSTPTLAVYDILLDRVLVRQQFPGFQPISSVTVTTGSSTIVLTFIATPGAYVYQNLEHFGLVALPTPTGAVAHLASLRLHFAPGIISIANLTLIHACYRALYERQLTRELLRQYGGGLHRPAEKRLPLHVGLQAIAGDASQHSTQCFRDIVLQFGPNRTPSRQEAFRIFDEIEALNHGVIDQEIQALSEEGLLSFAHWLRDCCTRGIDLSAVLFCLVLRYHGIGISKNTALIAALGPINDELERARAELEEATRVTNGIIARLVS